MIIIRGLEKAVGVASTPPLAIFERKCFGNTAFLGAVLRSSQSEGTTFSVHRTNGASVLMAMVPLPAAALSEPERRRLRISRSFLTGNFAPRAPQICLDVHLRAPVLGHGACWVHDVRLFSPEKDYFATYNWRPFGQKNPGGSHRLDVSQAPKEVPWTVS